MSAVTSFFSVFEPSWPHLICDVGLLTYFCIQYLQVETFQRDRNVHVIIIKIICRICALVVSAKMSSKLQTSFNVN